MKTAEEIIDEIQQRHSMGPYSYLDFKDCVEAMKAYASQALDSVAREWNLNKLRRDSCSFKTVDEIILAKKQELK